MLKRFYFHFLLLLLFFLLHGYSEYVGLIPFKDLAVFFATAAAAGFLLFLLFKKLVKSPLKAGVLTTLVLLFYLFYGSLRDALKAGPLPALSRYSILLPLMLSIIILLVWYFRKTPKSFHRLTLFINCLLLVYLLVDMAAIAFTPTARKPPPAAPATVTVCDTCRRPDMYVIVMDGYAGQRTLAQHFGYSNDHFLQALRTRGFYVPAAPSSNYSATPVSIASLFSMDYLPQFHRSITVEDYTRSEQVINGSAALQLAKAHGYRFINHSIFNLDGQPGRFSTDLLPMRLRLITAKTLWNSVYRDLGWQLHIKVAPRLQWVAGMLRDDYKNGNQRLLRHTLATAAGDSPGARLVYTHVLMPHWPYLFDSTGRATGINFYSTNMPARQKDSAYIQYLAYTNGRILELIDGIRRHSKGEAVILLLSDHGYRDWRGADDTFANRNNNLASVYIPGSGYHFFYDSISNVNLLRAVFNTVLQQRLPLREDRVVF